MKLKQATHDDLLNGRPGTTHHISLPRRTILSAQHSRISASQTPTFDLSTTSRTAMSRLLRGSLRTAPGPGGAGSIGHFTQPCRKIVLNYCQHSPASKGVRDWLSFGLKSNWQRIGAQNGVSVVGERGPLDAAKSWPQIEWVIQEGKRGTEPTVTAYYGE